QLPKGAPPKIVVAFLSRGTRPPSRENMCARSRCLSQNSRNPSCQRVGRSYANSLQARHFGKLTDFILIWLGLVRALRHLLSIKDDHDTQSTYECYYAEPDSAGGQ